MEHAIVEVHKRLSGKPYSQKGAISILYELKELGVQPPSVSTINRVLKRNGLVKESKTTSDKPKEYSTHYYDVQQMDLIGPRYLKGGSKFYVLTVIDKNNHMAGVYPIANKWANSIVPKIIDFWRSYQMPDYLRMDNELSFRGSNRYFKGLGLLLRTALGFGVTPLFIPPGEPWRNGMVEKFNDRVQSLFLDIRFSSLDEMQEKAKKIPLVTTSTTDTSLKITRLPTKSSRK